MKLRIESLSFAYEEKQIINDISFAAEKGEFIAVKPSCGNASADCRQYLRR